MHLFLRGTELLPHRATPSAPGCLYSRAKLRDTCKTEVPLNAHRLHSVTSAPPQVSHNTTMPRSCKKGGVPAPLYSPECQTSHPF